MLLEGFLCALIALGEDPSQSPTSEKAPLLSSSIESAGQNSSSGLHKRKESNVTEPLSLESIFDSVRNAFVNLLDSVYSEGLLNKRRAPIFGIIFFACASGGMEPIHTALVILWIVVWAYLY
ncbi:hypothetical protein XU18_1991 [Perkinsela sp. CCAP 1560/4]|nr:hypothetical protein XU18_1991 [Perkinsela sp. CCAP 1560/4]|eukprot:KNH07459.1 hypothetical protein XU18_1991 [Perkinsela sp. CCAP 1560/4]